MPSIYDIKPLFQNILRPLVVKIEDRGITANQITLAACGLSIVYGVGFFLSNAHWIFLIGLPFLMFLRMGLNAVDGMLAREFDQKSNLGFYLNELTDIISDIALYLPFIILSGLFAPLVLLVIFIAIITEIAGILALGLGKDRQYQGPFGKSDRAFAFGTLSLALAFYTIPVWALNGLFILFALAGFYTFYRRIKKGLK